MDRQTMTTMPIAESLSYYHYPMPVPPFRTPYRPLFPPDGGTDGTLNSNNSNLHCKLRSNHFS